MAASYIPPRDVDLVVWSTNFATLISDDPALYGLTPTDAGNIQTLVDAWNAAYTLAVNPSTRTPATVAAKDTAKLAMIPTVRTYASQIRINPGVANDDKIALGLNLPNNSPAPIPAPATQPVITIISAIPGNFVCKFRDEASSPTSRAKAANSIGCEIYVGVSSIPLTNPADCAYYGAAVKVPFVIEFEPEDAGKIATVYGRWVNRAGSAGFNFALRGPYSTRLSQVIV